MLLYSLDAFLLQAVYQGILVDFLRMAIPEIAMYAKADFADDIAQLVYVLVLHNESPFADLCCKELRYSISNSMGSDSIAKQGPPINTRVKQLKAQYFTEYFPFLERSYSLLSFTKATNVSCGARI